jgi:hypothetical protein
MVPLLFAIALPLGACGKQPLVPASSLNGAIANDALYACGARQSDRNKIAITAESGIGSGIWDRPEKEPDCPAPLPENTPTKKQF